MSILNFKCVLMKIAPEIIAHKKSYMTNSSNLLKLHSRGLLKSFFPEDKSPDLHKLFVSNPQGIYCGFDPTADSLHIGNLLPIITLLHCQRAGHQAIALVGGATARVGDPSGKTSERPAIQQDVIDNNISAIKKNIKHIFDNHYKYFCENQTKPILMPIILDNKEWYKYFNVIDFMCKVGRNFRLGDMLSRHSVQSRLNSKEGLCLSEFLYQTFQAYDWLYLYKNYNCTIQIGGNDQIGNIVSGYEYVKRFSKDHFFGITTPLVTTSTGEKLGKSAGNAIWLSAKKSSPFDLYQFFIRLPDSEIKEYLLLYTFLSDNEIEQIINKHMLNPSNKTAQKKLAEEVCKLVHGEKGLISAQKCTEALYGSLTSSLENLASLTYREIVSIFEGAKLTELSLDPGVTIMDLLLKVGSFDKESIAENAIQSGSVYINQIRINQPEQILLMGQHIMTNGITLLRIGKKNFHIIKWLNVGDISKERAF